MKKSVFTLVLLFSLLISPASKAQNQTVTLRVPNFVRPLAEKWVAEYTMTNTDIDFLFASGKSQDNKNTIQFTTNPDEGIPFARFAILPVTTKQSEAEKIISGHKLNTRKLKSLFFVDDEEDDEEEELSKSEQKIHIYIANGQQSVSKLFARYLGQQPAAYKGKKIFGDDSFLNDAITKDPLAITVNSLSNIFNLESRTLRDELSLLPLDLDKQGTQILHQGNLDDIITLLEQHRYSEIPVAKAGLDFDQANPLLADFVNWVLVNGIQYVHQFGLLQLQQNDLVSK